MIMSAALEEHDGMVSTGSRTTIKVHFADDIYTFYDEKQELEALVPKPRSQQNPRYKMDVSAKKKKPN